MEINDLVKELKMKLKNKYPDKSERKINEEISDRMGVDYGYLFDKSRSKNKSNKWSISQNNYNKVSAFFHDFKFLILKTGI
jgi:hypothetical protein